VRIEPLTSLARSLVETAIRLVIFTVPVALVATWCGVPPTWQSAAFIAFCIVWSGVVFAEKVEEANQTALPAAETPKRTVGLLTPADVAFEARKSTREPARDNSNSI
jgi:hypothetical protein